MQLRSFISPFAILSCIVFLLQPFAPQNGLRAQAREDGKESVPPLRLGLLTGIQTNLQRHTVFPFTGEFQTLVNESFTAGVTARYRLNPIWSVKAEVTRWRQDWQVLHDGDPRITVQTQDRAFLDIPVMLAAYLPLDFIPVYVAAGPALLISTTGAEERVYTVQYATFSERNGWQKSMRTYEDRAFRIGAVAEVGLDIPLSPRVSLLTSVRFLHPFGMAVDEPALSVRDFSYWRMAMGLQYAF